MTKCEEAFLKEDRSLDAYEERIARALARAKPLQAKHLRAYTVPILYVPLRTVGTATQPMKATVQYEYSGRTLSSVIH